LNRERGGQDFAWKTEGMGAWMDKMDCWHERNRLVGNRDGSGEERREKDYLEKVSQNKLKGPQ